jgi:mevalonate kinase
MPAFTATAPGKIILFGEHAVVYGRPAIAIPLSQIKARAAVMADPRLSPGQVIIQAPDIGLEANLHDLPADNPLAYTIDRLASALSLARLPSCIIRITSSIPVASGLGSGTAVTVALIRALAAFMGQPLPDEAVSDLAYQVEKLHHGTPSGIDNTVVTYARPVYFVRGSPLQTFTIQKPFTIVIGDTGVSSPTAQSVGDVRQAWQADPPTYEALFDRIGETTKAARRLLEKGLPQELGALMDANHAVLQKIGVSSPELERLVVAARLAGALGAKLSGGGRGGNMIALVPPDASQPVSQALHAAGAVRTLVTEVKEV